MSSLVIYADNPVGLPLFQFELLRNQPGFTHGISTRHAPSRPRFSQNSPTPSATRSEWEVSGSNNRSMLLTDPAAYDRLIKQRRTEFLAALGLEAEQAILNLTAGQQRHTANVAIVGPEAYRAELNWGHSLPNIDAVVTNQPGLPLMSIHADCPPILLFDPVQRVAATVHSGWRGTVGKIGLATVQQMQETYGCQPQHILAGIGPSIGPCCYEVGEPVLTAVQAAFGPQNTLLQYRETKDKAAKGSWYFDLWAANQQLLLEAGLQPQHIENSALCTRCHADTFFSYRAIGEAQRQADGYGLFGAVVAILE